MTLAHKMGLRYVMISKMIRVIILNKGKTIPPRTHPGMMALMTVLRRRLTGKRKARPRAVKNFIVYVVSRVEGGRRRNELKRS